MTKKTHECKDCKHLTGTPRPYIYCRTCKKGYMDFCTKGHWDFELRYD